VESTQPITEAHPNPHVDEVHSPARARPAITAEPWPERSPPSAVGERPIAVQVLGPYRISVHGEEVRTGLRSRAMALLAWYSLRPWRHQRPGCRGDLARHAARAGPETVLVRAR
jgi:hypothetical protein